MAEMAAPNENNASDDFQSFVNEFAAEAKFFGRASLPTEFTGTVTADLRSSVSMETTTTATTPFDYSPCTSERNSIDYNNLRTPKSAHEFTYTVSSQPSPISPATPKPAKPPRILYGPCPDRHYHSAEPCPTCHLTDQQYRIERLEQSRHVYGKLSREYATAAKKSQRSSSVNAKEKPANPPPTPAEKCSTTAMTNGRKDRKTLAAYPPPTFSRHLTSALQHQQQRRSSLAIPASTRVSLAPSNTNATPTSRRTSLTPSMPARVFAPTMSSSRKSIAMASPARKLSMAPSNTTTPTPSSRKTSLTPVIPSTSRLLAPTMSSTRKSVAMGSPARKLSMAPSNTSTPTPSSRKTSLTPILPSTSRLLAPTRKSIGQSSRLL